MTKDQYDTAVTRETLTFTAAETEAAAGGYPGGVPPFRQSESSAGRSPSSYSGPSHGDPSTVTQAMSPLPDGENYGYGRGRPSAQSTQADDLRRHNSSRSRARHGGNDEASRAARHAYPQDGYQGTRSYPASGYPDTGHQGSGHQAGYQGSAYADSSYPGGAHQGSHRLNGHRAPYDPRDDYLR